MEIKKIQWNNMMDYFIFLANAHAQKSSILSQYAPAYWLKIVSKKESNNHLNLVWQRAHAQLSNTPSQNTIAPTTKKKELQHCSIYMEIGTIYDSS